MKPLILAVDTTHEFGSLALTRGQEILEEVLLHAPQGFGDVLYDHLRGLLSRHAVSPHEIDCFASASGPGSFTGVRIGLACIKGLAEAVERPAVGVGNLEAMARFGTEPLRAVVMDARRGEVYGAVYDESGSLVLPEVVVKFPVWLETLPEAVEFVSTDFSPFGPSLVGTRFQHSPVVTAPRAQAGAVACIAARRFLNGEACDPAAIDANYIRRSDAELFWKQI